MGLGNPQEEGLKRLWILELWILFYGDLGLEYPESVVELNLDRLEG